MTHKVLAIAGSPRRNGNTERLLDRALEGVKDAAPNAEARKIILNELQIKPCQACGYCAPTGRCRFADTDDMKLVYEALDASDRLIIASPIHFASVSTQVKAMVDRSQAIWARKYLLKQPHANPDRKALFLCCGGLRKERFFECTRQVLAAWCTVNDIKLSADLFFPGIDASGEIEQHPTALDDAFAAGKELLA